MHTIAYYLIILYPIVMADDHQFTNSGWFSGWTWGCSWIRGTQGDFVLWTIWRSGLAARGVTGSFIPPYIWLHFNPSLVWSWNRIYSWAFHWWSSKTSGWLAATTMIFCRDFPMNPWIFMILAKIFHHFPSNPWIFAAGVGSRCLVFGALRTDSDALPTGRGRADGHGDPSDGRNGSDGHLAKPGHGDDVEILMIYYSYIIHIINKMDMINDIMI